MTEVIGIDHIYIAVSDLERSELFYDRVLLEALGFRKNIEASEAKLYTQYAPDYWATFFTDPDGVRLEVTNYRLERRERHDNW